MERDGEFYWQIPCTKALIGGGFTLHLSQWTYYAIDRWWICPSIETMGVDTTALNPVISTKTEGGQIYLIYCESYDIHEIQLALRED